MAKYQDRTFRDDVVRIDGNHYRDCTFERCNIEYGATDAIGLEGCTFDECTFILVGPAGQTILFLTALYSMEGTRELVEGYIGDIQNGVIRNIGGDLPGE